MTKEEIAAYQLAWNVLWSIVTLIGAWLISRNRAQKGEIAVIKALIDAKADKPEILDVEQRVEAKADKDLVQSHERKLTEHDRRIQSVEAELSHMPTRNQVHEIDMSMEALKGNLNLISQTLATNIEITRRIETFLWEQKSKE